MWKDLDDDISELFAQEHPLLGERPDARALGTTDYYYHDRNKSREAAAHERAQHEARIALAKTATSKAPPRAKKIEDELVGTAWGSEASKEARIRTETRICERCGEYFTPRWPSQKHCDVTNCVCRPRC